MNANDPQNSTATTTASAAQQDTDTHDTALSSSDIVETVPTAWDDDRDGRFFRLVHDAFSPAFLLGGTVLLSSYDED